PISLRMRLGDVEPRLPVIERVGVVELLRQKIGIARLIAQAEPPNIRQTRKVGENERAAEELLGKHVDQSSEADVRSPTGAARCLVVQLRNRVSQAADVAEKADHPGFFGVTYYT